MSFHNTIEVLYISWVMYFVGACVILYILVRHWLLVSERLSKDDLGCGQCSKATFTWLKSLCKAPFCERTAATEEPLEFNEYVVRYCTFSSVLFHFLYCLNQVVMYASAAIIGWLPFAYCENSYKIGPMLYFVAKASMYSVFVARLQLGFADTKYAVRKGAIHALYGCVGLSQIGFFYIAGALIKGERTRNGSVHNCIISAPWFIHYSFISFDLFFTVSVVYLFISKLKKMLRDFEQKIGVEKNMDRNAYIYALPLKYTILSSIATVSTMTAILLIAATDLVLLFAVDCVVNSSTLILMTGQWSPVFDILCTPLLKCLPCAPLMGAKTTLMAPKASTRPLTAAPTNADDIDQSASDLQSID